MSSYWNQVLADGFDVPTDRPLDDLTAELTRMLGSADPAVRDQTAYSALATWTERGVYDELLAGLGDGMAAGLAIGLGESGSDTVFRRSFSVLVLGKCIARDTAASLLPAGKILEWGDRIATWYVREHDLRGFVAGKGWAHAVAHGADALGALAASPHVGSAELTVLLDVLADRVAPPPGALPADGGADSVVFGHGEPDRMAAATMAVLRRNLLPLSVVEPWIARLISIATTPTADDTDPALVRGNAEAFLRALHLQVALSPDPPELRPDLLLELVAALRVVHPTYLSNQR